MAPAGCSPAPLGPVHPWDSGLVCLRLISYLLVRGGCIRPPHAPSVTARTSIGRHWAEGALTQSSSVGEEDGRCKRGGGDAGAQFRRHWSPPRLTKPCSTNVAPSPPRCSRPPLASPQPTTQPGGPGRYEGDGPLDRGAGWWNSSTVSPKHAIGWNAPLPARQLTSSPQPTPPRASSLGSQTPRSGGLCDGAGAGGRVAPCSRPPHHLGGLPPLHPGPGEYACIWPSACHCILGTGHWALLAGRITP